MAPIGPRASPEPVRASFSDERHALPLAQELIGLLSVDVEAADAIRRSLGADLGAVVGS
jgi:hypothetical protein